MGDIARDRTEDRGRRTRFRGIGCRFLRPGGTLVGIGGEALDRRKRRAIRAVVVPGAMQAELLALNAR